MNKFIYLLILVIAIVLWFFMYKERPPNQISISVENNTQKLLETSIQKTEIKKKRDKPLDEFSDLIPVLNTNSESDSKLTYLQAYRNTLAFQKCFQIIQDLNKGISPLIKFKKNASFDMYSLPDETKKQATDLQIQYYSDNIQMCQSFLNDNNESFTSAMKRQQDLFNSIEAKTVQEQQLAEGLELYNQYIVIKDSLKNATASYSLLSDEELQDINLKIKNLTNQIAELDANPDSQTNNQIQKLIIDLYAQRSKLFKKIRRNKISETDNKLKISIEEEIQIHKNKLINFLKQNNSPDVLLLYSRLIFYPASKVYNPILDDMKRELNTYQTHLMLSLYEVGIKLAACAMNYPCDDQSQFIMDYCVGGSKYANMYPSACGKTIEDFYFNDYLSPNQLDDVSIYMNYILENYAN